MNSDNDFDPGQNDWREDLARAGTRLILRVAAMVPFVAAGLVFTSLLHGLFSQPGGFTCKSIPSEASAKAAKHHPDRLKIIPTAPVPEYRLSPPAEIPKPEAIQDLTD